MYSNIASIIFCFLALDRSVILLFVEGDTNNKSTPDLTFFTESIQRRLINVKTRSKNINTPLRDTRTEFC